MNHALPDALQRRFRYMSPLEGEERHRAYMFFRGWVAPLAKACEGIDELLGADKRAFHWVRLREKFGGPSFAYRMEGEARASNNIHRPADVRRHKCGRVEGQGPVALAVSERGLQVEWN